MRGLKPPTGARLRTQLHWVRIRWLLMRRRMRFFRHFQRMWPRFFQTRELRFIQVLPRERAALQGTSF